MVFAAVFAGVALVAIFGFYQSEKNGTNIFLRGDDTKTADSTQELPAQQDAADVETVPPPAPSTPTPTTSQPAPSSSSSSSACGNAAIPEGACTAILDVEKNTLKNSSYTAVDTSQIPDGTTVIFKKDTWTSNGSSTGSVDATLTYASQPYSIRVSLSVRDGVWKVTSYTSN